MQDKFIDLVYDTLNGYLTGEDAVPGVENAFENGAYCMNKYEEVYQTKIQLFKRLGSWDDEEVESIVDNMMDIQRELCCQMYRLGAKFGGAAQEDYIKRVQNCSTNT